MRGKTRLKSRCIPITLVAQEGAANKIDKEAHSGEALRMPSTPTKFHMKNTLSVRNSKKFSSTSRTTWPAPEWEEPVLQLSLLLHSTEMKISGLQLYKT